jgi:hypothetical protein
MSRLEKHAWFNIGVVVVTCALFAVAAPYAGILPASASFGLCGLWGLAPYLFYPKGNMGAALDERERAITRRAWTTGHAMFWLLFVCAFMLTWFLHSGEDVTVPADTLPLMVIAGWMLVVLVTSLAMLVLCRTGLRHAAL